MSKKKFEECLLSEATHIEVGGKLCELGNKFTSKQEVLKYNDYHIDVCRKGAGWQLIHVDTFPILGIKPMREVKPIEFEAKFVKHDGKWYPMYGLDDGFLYPNCKMAMFKCVEILEVEE